MMTKKANETNAKEAIISQENKKSVLAFDD